MVTLQDLKNECDIDPLTLGYGTAGWSKPAPTEAEFQAVADILNSLETGRTLGQEFVAGLDIYLAIESADFDTLYDGTDEGNKEHIRFIISMDRVDIKNVRVAEVLNFIFPASTFPETNAALQALSIRAVSRAEELGGRRAVRVGDLRAAKDLP